MDPSPSPAPQSPSSRRTRRSPKADLYLTTAGVVAVLAVVIPLAFDGYDNDVWFILASGRRIVETGFPATNPWAVYEDLGIVIQQWVPDVLAYLCYGLGGWYGLVALLLLACAALVGALLALGHAASPEARPETVVICSALALVGLQAYISFRPQVYTMTLVCLVIALLERYRAKRDARLLLWLVPLEVAHVNFHAAMAPIDIAIVAAYCLPDARRWWDRGKRWLAARWHPTRSDGTPLLGERALEARRWGLSQADYPRLPLVCAMPAMALAMLANPYGLEGALYLAHSYGAADYGNYIEEMKALMPTTAQFGIVFLAVCATALCLIGRRGPRRVDLPLTLCALVLGYLGFQHVRNVWLVVPFAYALLLKGVRRLPVLPADIVRPTRGVRLVACAVTALVALLLGYAGTRTLSPGPFQDGANTPEVGVDAIDEIVPEELRSSTGVFCTFEAGGYLEWRGYQVSMDARPELWEPGITRVGEHYYQDYVDMCTGTESVADQLERADCDFVISTLSSNVNSYLLSSTDYRRIEASGSYQVWERVSS